MQGGPMQNNFNPNMNSMSPMNQGPMNQGANPMNAMDPGAMGPYRKPQTTGQKHTGVIRTFNSAGNYAFIQCDALKSQFEGKDVWCRGDLLVGKNIGETIVFELGLNLKGQPQALSIMSAMDGAPQGPPQGGMLALTQGMGAQSGGTPATNGGQAVQQNLPPRKSKWDQKSDDMAKPPTPAPGPAQQQAESPAAPQQAPPQKQTASEQQTAPQQEAVPQQGALQKGTSPEEQKKVDGFQRLQSMLLSTGKKVGRVVSYSAEIGCGFLQYISSSEQVFFGVDQNEEIAKQSAPESGEGCLFELGRKNSGEACAVNVLLLRGANAERMLQMSASFPPYMGEAGMVNGQQQQPPSQQQQSSQPQQPVGGESQPAKSEAQPGQPQQQQQQDDKTQQQLLQQQLLQQLPAPETETKPAQPSYM